MTGKEHSDSVSSDGSSAESSATGALTRVPSASGTRIASASRRRCRSRRRNPRAGRRSGTPPGRSHRCCPTTRTARSRISCLDAPTSEPWPPPRRRTRGPSARPGPTPASAGKGAGRCRTRSAHDPHQRIRRLLQLRVGDLLHPDVTRAVHERCSHHCLLSSGVIPRLIAAHTPGNPLPPRSGSDCRSRY